MHIRQIFWLPVFLCFALCFTALPLHISMAQSVVPQSRQQIQLSYSPVVKKVTPAVVNIYTTRVVERRSMGHPFFNDPFFRRFFGTPNLGGRMQERVENSLGSGVIINDKGMIITNAHVIEGADEIQAVLADGREFNAELKLADKASDLALLQMKDIAGVNFPYATLKPSETLEVGDIVLAIGNPFGVGQTVTSGIISAQGRSALDINDFNFFIQTDAAINPGNSGGPLVALDGGVVGINTAIFSRDGGSLGIGFAIPSEMVASLLAAAEQGQNGNTGVIRPWLGITAQTVTSDIANSLGLSRPYGALVAELHPASPLAAAGIKAGDLILSIEGKEIRDAASMKFRMATIPIGEEAEFQISRQGDISIQPVKAIAPPNDPPRNDTLLDGAHLLNGATIATINPAVILEFELSNTDEGIVITDVERRSTAARIVRPGDIVVRINGQDIHSQGDVKNALSGSSGRNLDLTLKRNGQMRRLMLR